MQDITTFTNIFTLNTNIFTLNTNIFTSNTNKFTSIKVCIKRLLVHFKKSLLLTITYKCARYYNYLQTYLHQIQTNLQASKFVCKDYLSISNVVYYWLLFTNVQNITTFTNIFTLNTNKFTSIKVCLKRLLVNFKSSF